MTQCVLEHLPALESQEHDIVLALGSLRRVLRLSTGIAVMELGEFAITITVGQSCHQKSAYSLGCKQPFVLRWPFLGACSETGNQTFTDLPFFLFSHQTQIPP